MTLKKVILTWDYVFVPVLLHVDRCYSAIGFSVHTFFNILATKTHLYLPTTYKLNMDLQYAESTLQKYI